MNVFYKRWLTILNGLGNIASALWSYSVRGMPIPKYGDDMRLLVTYGGAGRRGVLAGKNRQHILRL